MQFPGLLFLFYFLPVFFVLHSIFAVSRTVGNVILFIASLLFYAWGGQPWHLALLALVILMNWALGLVIGKLGGRDNENARTAMVVAITVNLGIFVLCRYSGFLAWNLNMALGRNLVEINFPEPPLGLAFFILNAISYVIDIYRQNARAEANPINAGLYISFFPLLIAGPVVRFEDFAEQLHNRAGGFTFFSKGCCRFIIGLGKVVLLASPMKEIADHVFHITLAGDQLMVIPMLLAWLGLAAFTLQVYFMLSGYADMGIGLGGMFGFRIGENFDYPYVATTATEFWRRWSISIVDWFKKYCGRLVMGVDDDLRQSVSVRNLLLVWLLFGLWHGAGWTFIAWGGWFCSVLIFEQVTRLTTRRFSPILGHIYLLFVVGVGWVLFRADDMRVAMAYFANLLAVNNNGIYSDLAMVLLRENWVFFVIGIIFCTPLARELGRKTAMEPRGVLGRVFALLYPVIILAVFALSVVYLVERAP